MVHDSIPVLRRRDLENACEMLWLELHAQRGVIDFITYYRPPTTSVDSLQALHSAFGAVPATRSIILCGDFNAPHIDWLISSPTVKSPVTDALCQLVCDNFLSQLVHEPT